MVMIDGRGQHQLSMLRARSRLQCWIDALGQLPSHGGMSQDYQLYCHPVVSVIALHNLFCIASLVRHRHIHQVCHMHCFFV